MLMFSLFCFILLFGINMFWNLSLLDIGFVIFICLFDKVKWCDSLLLGIWLVIFICIFDVGKFSGVEVCFIEIICLFGSGKCEMSLLDIKY